MKIYTEQSIENFEAWSGAKETQEIIIREGKAEEFDCLIEELYPEGMGETELNDLLWFEDEWIFEQLDIEFADEDEK